MPKLNQIIAIEKGVKSRSYEQITELDKAAQKPALFNGFSKEYKKLDDGGEDLPPEKQRVQYVAMEVLRRVAQISTDYFKVVARKDWTNCIAKAAVMIDGKEVIPPAPVSYLLFLEKQLNDLHTMVGRLPVLDEAEEWKKDAESGFWRTEASPTHRTKKSQRPIVLYDATEKHPAQTQLITDDILVGHWLTTKLSGAMRKPDKYAILERIEKMQMAVKEAREHANGHEEVDSPNVGEAVFGFILGEK